MLKSRSNSPRPNHLNSYPERLKVRRDRLNNVIKIDGCLEDVQTTPFRDWIERCSCRNAEVQQMVKLVAKEQREARGDRHYDYECLMFCYHHEQSSREARRDLENFLSHQLGLEAWTPTQMTLELANRSITHPIGIAEDVVVRVDGFTFLVDFVWRTTTHSDDLILVFSGEVLVIILRKFAMNFLLLYRFTTGNDDSTFKKDLHEENFQVYSNPLFEFDDNFKSSTINPLFDEMEEMWRSIFQLMMLSISRSEVISDHGNQNKIESLKLLFLQEVILFTMSSPSLPVSPIPVEDSEPAQEEIDIFLIPDDLIPPGAENDDSEDKDNELPNLDHQDDPSIPRPSRKPPDVEKCFEPEAGILITKVFKGVSKLHDFMADILPTLSTLVSYLTFILFLSSFLSFESEDTIFDPGIITFSYLKPIDPTISEDSRVRPDDSIPPGIESYFDSEEDIIDNLLNDDPIPEYERLTFDMEPDVPMINNVYELNEDECFDPGGGEINVEVDDSFTFVIRTFLPYLTY
ncbi:hypothetical protein Tco_0019930 [Tanacetum coccineum]